MSSLIDTAAEWLANRLSFKQLTVLYGALMFAAGLLFGATIERILS